MQNEKLILRSENRNNGILTNFFKTLPHTFYNIKSCSLLYANIPYTFYNVNEFNNTIVYNEGSSDITITIQPGHYEIDDFILEVATQMTANSGAAITYTATRNATTEKITITGSSNFSLLFNNSLNNTSNKSV